MGMTKYTKTESQEVLSIDEYKVINNTLQKTGKTSVKDLDDEERENLSKSLDKHK